MIREDEASVLLGQLEHLVHNLGVTVRYELLGEEDDTVSILSGTCRLRNERVIIVDSRMGAAERCRVLAAELRRFDLSRIFVPPAVRRLIEGPD